MSAPVLAILLRSEAFHEQCAEVALAAGAELRVARNPEELEVEGACGLLLLASDSEFEAVHTVQELCGRGSAEVAVVGTDPDYRVGIRLVQAGARDYFVLPADFAGVRAWIAERVAGESLAEAAGSYAADQRELFDFSQLVGESEGLRAALDRAARVIPHGTATVLITGETGTGKDVLARAIHFNGPRAAQPFVEVNCTALPASLLEAELFGYEAGAFTDARTSKPGLFELANGGTLFLDEIGDLTLELQAKLLRVLEDRRVRRLGSVKDVALNVRIVAATHVDLQQAVAESRFRSDLFFRLAVAPLHLPPLRDRGRDVILLAEHFLDYFTREYGAPRPELTPEIRQALLGYHWPGNVRELRNAIERSILFGEGQMRPVDLFFAAPGNGSRTEGAGAPGEMLPFPARMRDIERAAARAMVEHCGGNKSEAAKILGISRKQLYSLLRPSGSAV